MNTYIIETTLPKDGTVTLTGLPLRAGAKVEITVRSREQDQTNRYPLRGTPYRFVDPTGGVAEEDWEAAR